MHVCVCVCGCVMFAFYFVACVPTIVVIFLLFAIDSVSPQDFSDAYPGRSVCSSFGIETVTHSPHINCSAVVENYNIHIVQIVDWIQWNLSNSDTLGQIKCVLIRGVSSFQGRTIHIYMKLGLVLIREVSLIQGCPLRGEPWNFSEHFPICM